MKNNYIDLALAILRIGFSGMLMTHGIPKINTLLQDPSSFSDPVGIGSIGTLLIAILAEVIAPLLIIIGFKTRIATLPTIITMGIAAFIVHGSQPLANKEMALLYFIAFITIAIAGPGKYAVDKR